MKIEGVSFVVPAYNEAEMIEAVVENLHRELSALALIFEILVIDDASTDETRKKVPLLKAQLLEHNVNMGYGASLKTGIRHARYPWIFIIDADGSYPIEAIKNLLAEVNESTDMVVGSRTGSGSQFSLSREPAKWFLKQLAQYLTGQKIKDLNSGMRIFRKDLALKFMHILPSKFSFTTTITLAAICNDYVVKYEDIVYRKRVGRSKIRPLQDSAYFFSLILRTVLYFNPLKIFVPFAVMLFLSAGAVFIFSKFIFGKVADLTTLLLVLSGFQMIGIGLLADLIDKRLAKE